VREKFACRDCEAVTEPPAPSHAIPRGFAGPSLLAMILVVGKCSVAAIYSVFGATSLLTLMRYADWRPITLAGFLSPMDPAG